MSPLKELQLCDLNTQAIKLCRVAKEDSFEISFATCGLNHEIGELHVRAFPREIHGEPVKSPDASFRCGVQSCAHRLDSFSQIATLLGEVVGVTYLDPE